MKGRSKFRPCIDIHNGKVKQLVGGSLRDQNDSAKENFVSERDAGYFASLYQKDKLAGGHIILLNSKDSDYYEQTRTQALKALKAYPLGMQLGGGVDASNAKEYIDAGASHVIVTSFVFRDGKVDFDRLEQLVNAVGKDRIVLDLSCRKKSGEYYIVTDRWQKFTEEKINDKTLSVLSGYCDEFLVHGVDVEGKSGGMEEELVKILAAWSKIPITYAGGISTKEQIEYFNEISQGEMDYTIGSALDLFGGSLKYDEIKLL